MYRDKTLKQYLDDLAAKIPAPGGGSAAALNAGLGASLISMVVNFTLGKPKYAEYQKELKAIFKKSEGLRKEFLNLTDADVLAYNSGNINKALNVPLRVCRLCFEAAKLCPALIKKSNLNLASDVAVAAALLEAAFTSAYFNVEINLRRLPAKKSSGPIRSELLQKKRAIEKLRRNTEDKVGKIIRG